MTTAASYAQEAPVFEPMWDEFQDPSAYIEKIRPVAESRGMCIIRPPQQWRPTCAIDVDKDSFSFTAKVQHLSDFKDFASSDSNAADYTKVKLSLKKFGYLADQLKIEYFSMPVDKVTEQQVEVNFWKLLSDQNNRDLRVYTGCRAPYSCFPTHESSPLLPEDKEYVDSAWNLSKFAERGMLRNLNSSDIVHLKKPKCTVAMCFSSDTWKLADHWGYTVNYMHWGESRTWYAVCGANAEKFNKYCHLTLGSGSLEHDDGFNNLPMFHPDIIRSCNITVVKAVQQTCEFLVVFPHAYSMWFSHGFNLVESVNFYPIHWLPVGLECHKWYQTVRKQCQFSFEELLCSLLSEHNEVELLPMHCQLLKQLIDEDQLLASKARDTYRIVDQKEFFPELLPTRERRCAECRTICFLSAIMCQCHCTANKVVCCRHGDKLCSCDSSKRVLLYRYSPSYLQDLLDELQYNVDVYTRWSAEVTNALSSDSDSTKFDLARLKMLQREAKKSWTTSTLYQQLAHAVQKAAEYSREARKLISWSRKSRELQNNDLLTYEEMQLFTKQINGLQCKIPEADTVREMLQAANELKKEINYHFKNNVLPTARKLQLLIEQSENAEIFLPETSLLKQWKLDRQWLDDVSAVLKNAENMTVDSMRQMIEKGVGLPPHPWCESVLLHLQQLQSLSTAVDERARQCLLSRPSQTLVQAQSILDEASRITAHLPNVVALRTAVDMAARWTASIDKLLSQPHSPFVSVLENYVSIAHTIPIHLDRLPQLESCISAAKSWYERAAKAFLKKNSTFTLLEVLVPRTDIGMAHGYKLKRRKAKDINNTSHGETSNVLRLLSDVSVDYMPDPNTLVVAFREDQSNELDAMGSLRTFNTEKLNGHVDVAADKYCICRHSRTNSMLQCEVCKDLFHPECVSAAKPTGKSGYVSETKFLCPMCSRSRRPRLDVALSLLLSLQKLPVRVDCGEALQLLAERAMAWQDAVKTFLANDEMPAVLTRLGEKTSDHTAAAAAAASAHERADRIVTAEMHRFGLMHRRSSSGSTSSQYDERKGAYESDTSAGSMMPIEHAYSSVSKHGATISQPTTTHRRVPNVSSAATAQSSSSSVWLSNSTRHQLEQLMMQGDMIEVTLDETQLLWRVLRACHPSVAESSTPRAKGPTDILSSAAKADGAEEQHRKRRKHLEVRAEDSQMEVFISQKKLKDKSVKVSERLDDDTKKSKAPKFNKKNKSKQKQRQQTTEDEEFLTAADNNDDDCSAAKCLKPLGREVDWVQCDNCQLWFHLICVGLSKTDVSDDKDYICRTCEGRHLPAGVVRSSGGELVTAAGDSYRARSKTAGGASSRSSAAVSSRVTRESFACDETVVQSAEVGHTYVNAADVADDDSGGGGDGDYETQIIEYDTGDLNGVAVGTTTELTIAQSEAVDMECHETLDADAGAPSGHVVIALGEDQVVYMYADVAGTEIEGMEDMVEIETVESAADLQLHESCDQVAMDHVEEDSETCHELVLVDSCQTGIIIEQSALDDMQSEMQPAEAQQEFVPADSSDMVSVADHGDVVSEDQLIEPVQYIPLSAVEHLGLAGITIDGSNLIRSVTGVDNIISGLAVAECISEGGAIDSYEVAPDGDAQ